MHWAIGWLLVWTLYSLLLLWVTLVLSGRRTWISSPSSPGRRRKCLMLTRPWTCTLQRRRRGKPMVQWRVFVRSSQPEYGFVCSYANVRASVANQICFYDYAGTREGGGTGGTSPHRVLCGGSVPPQNLTAAGTLFRHLWSSDQWKGHIHSLVSFSKPTPPSKQAQDERVSVFSVADSDYDNIGKVNKDKRTIDVHVREVTNFGPKLSH